MPQGAEEADGVDSLIRVVRDQIGRGADWIKVYADYSWGPNGEAEPTFSLDELKLIVETAKSSGRAIAAHASTPEGMRRAALAGVETIEHGDGKIASAGSKMDCSPTSLPSTAIRRDWATATRLPRGIRRDTPLSHTGWARR